MDRELRLLYWLILVRNWKVTSCGYINNKYVISIGDSKGYTTDLHLYNIYTT